MLKKITLFTFILIFSTCNSTKNMAIEKHSIKMNFLSITKLIDNNGFEQIKKFVLKNGGKKTYRNFDNSNPHYRFNNCDVFFGADIGQRNINNDPKISDFNELTIFDNNSDISYYELITVKKGDLKAEKHWIREGMQENQVYLVDVYNKGLIAMENKLPNYLKQIKEEIQSANK